jgi:hypothetical protein
VTEVVGGAVLVLLVGSAASAPQTKGGLGVPGVRETVELVVPERRVSKVHQSSVHFPALRSAMT